MAKNRLSTKQQSFVDLYDGNGVEAARKAGYKGSDNVLRSIASQNLTKLNIQQAIFNREKERNKKGIWDVEQLQKWWTDVLDGKVCEEYINADNVPGRKPASLHDRLSASDKLAKSHAAYIEKRVVAGDKNAPIKIIVEQRMINSPKDKK